MKGVKLSEILPHLGLTPDDIWSPGSDMGLWNARLFVVAKKAEGATEYSLKILDIIEDIKNGKSPASCTWKSMKRLSLSEAIALKVKIIYNIKIP